MSEPLPSNPLREWLEMLLSYLWSARHDSPDRGSPPGPVDGELHTVPNQPI